MRCSFWLLLAPLALGCATREADAPEPLDLDRAALRVELASAVGIDVLGAADQPALDTDEQPRYQLFVRDHAGAHPRRTEIVALDATADADTRSLIWLATDGTLWSAPLSTAPADARALADEVIPGLAASRGRVAFARRLDGPETAPFVADLRSLRISALADAPGPDEVLAFSPAGDEVLLLSGRTGLASLFAVGVNEPSARQLTNAGLAPGPDLDPARVAPTPITHRDVVWGARGIAYRAHGEVIGLAPGRALERLDERVSIQEWVR